MADNSKISPEDLQKVLKWVNDKAGNRPIVCSICQTSAWTLSEHLVTPTVVTTSGQVMLGGTTYPNASLICKNCGNMHLLNAVMIGIVAPEKEGEANG